MDCKICGSATEIFDKAVVLQKYDVTYFRCQTCGAIFTEKPHWLDEAYSEAIAAIDVGLVHRNINLFPLFCNIIDGLWRNKTKFLDFAGGVGLWTRLMRDRGYDFYWYDKYAKDIFNPPFVDVPQVTEHYDVVTAMEVFEHLEDPRKELPEILSHTDNLIFTTEVIPPQVKKISDWYYFAPLTGQHITFYTPQALMRLGALFGLHYIGTPSVHIYSREALDKSAVEKCFTGQIQPVERQSLMWRDFDRACQMLSEKSQK